MKEYDLWKTTSHIIILRFKENDECWFWDYDLQTWIKPIWSMAYHRLNRCTRLITDLEFLVVVGMSVEESFEDLNNKD